MTRNFDDNYLGVYCDLCESEARLTGGIVLNGIQ